MAELGRLLYVGATRAEATAAPDGRRGGRPDGSDWEATCARFAARAAVGRARFVTARGTTRPRWMRPGDPRRGRLAAAAADRCAVAVLCPPPLPGCIAASAAQRTRPCSTGRMPSRQRLAPVCTGFSRRSRRRCRPLGRAPAARRARTHPRRARHRGARKPVCGSAAAGALRRSSRGTARRSARPLAVRSGPRSDARSEWARWPARTKGEAVHVVVDRSLYRAAVAMSSISRRDRIWVAIPRDVPRPGIRSAIDRSSPATPASSARSMHDRSDRAVPPARRQWLAGARCRLIGPAGIHRVASVDYALK